MSVNALKVVKCQTLLTGRQRITGRRCSGHEVSPSVTSARVDIRPPRVAYLTAADHALHSFSRALLLVRGAHESTRRSGLPGDKSEFRGSFWRVNR